MKTSAIHAEIDGLDDLVRRLNALPIDLRNRVVRNTAGRGGGVLRDSMKRRVRRRTHALERSITVTVRRTREGAEAHVGPTQRAFHGRFLEFGTRFMTAKPFMRPALVEDGEQAVAVMGRDIGEFLAKAEATQARRLARASQG